MNLALEPHSMSKKIPIHPAHPERLCWGCDRYCPADSLACGNGSERCPHPAELFGNDWMEWHQETEMKPPCEPARVAGSGVER